MKLPILFISISVLPILGCSSDDSPSSSNGGSGTLILRMTDTPAFFDSVVIAVDSVRAHVDNGDSISGWFTLNRTPSMYNLLALVNGVDTVIGSAILPAGNYSQIRLYLGGGSYLVVGGLHFPLVVPSGSQSGLKLNVHADILANVTYTIVLDFDAARSIVLTGSGQYMLKPVIRVVTVAQTGIITGIVVPGSAHPLISAFATTDTMTTLADPSGAFRLMYLTLGSYIVRVAPAGTTFRDTTFSGVLVLAGNTTSLGTIVLRSN